MQALNAQGNNLYFENYSSEEGLSQNSINCFAQDHFGFIWMGTENGLNKFDGYQIINYFEETNNENSLSSGTIHDLFVDRANRIWIATSNGLNYFDQRSEKFHRIRLGNNSSNNNQRINHVFIDSKNYLWLGGPKGVKKSQSPINEYFNAEKRIVFKDLSAKLSKKNIVFIFEDSEQDIWIGTSKEIYLIRNKEKGKIDKIKLPERFDTDNAFKITSIAEDKKMRFWIGTEQGLLWYNKELESFTNLKNHPFFIANPKANFIKKILVDHKGHIFIGTFGAGLLQFLEKENNFVAYVHNQLDPNSLPRNYIYTLFEDQSKTLFVSVVGAGFCKSSLENKKFYQYTNRNLKDNYIVRALYLTNYNDLWIGLQTQGLDKLDLNNNTFTHYSFPSKEKNEDITVKTIVPYDSVNLLLGTFFKGVLLFNTKTGTFKQFAPEIPQLSKIHYITDIKINTNKQVWISTFHDGVYVYKPQAQSLNHYHEKSKNTPLFNNSISSICFDRKGRVWLTSMGGGLGILNPKTGKIKNYFKDKLNKSRISSNTLTSCLIDKDNVYLGSSAGICKYIPEKDTFEVFNRKQGISDEFINALVKDKKGNIWVCTNKGISFFNLKTKSFINFSRKDGLQADEFNMGASCVFPDGRIAFGGIKGFNIFSPDSIQIRNFIPIVNIYKLQLFNKEVGVNQKMNKQTILKQSILSTKEINLNYLNNFISFEFSAQDYTKPEAIKYQYILEGFEKEWNTCSYKYRKATYTNLEPGKYIFKVRSTNSDGVFQENTKSIVINVKPPFWQTIWFYLFVFTISLIILSLIIYLSNKWMIKQNKKLETKVDQRTLALEEKNISLADKIAQINQQKIELQEKTEELTLLNADLEIFSTVVKEMRNTLLVMDNKGDFLIANKAFDETYKYLGDLKEKYGNNIFKMPLEEHVRKIINRCFNEKVPVQFEAEYTKMKGEKIWVHSNMTPILDDKGDIKNVVLIETNITEIKLRETQILELAEELYKKAEDLNIKNQELETKNRKITEQSQELQSLTENLELANKNLEEIVQKRTLDMRIAKEQAEKANQLKTVFLLNLSHEIRTPMNAICGFSELMADDRASLEKRKAYAKIINDNVDVLLRLIDNIMDLSKLQAKQIKLNNIVFNVKQKLEDIYYLYVVDDKFIKDNVAFNIQLKGIDKVNIYADSKRFETIFTNLIDNAIKYTDNGSITLTAKVEKKLLEIAVTDTGIGIKKEEISKIFEYFRKVDDNIKLYRGTGLGLSIVREILDIYHWNIQVESTLGKGSSFIVKIPID